jgi:hypothetical protein
MGSQASACDMAWASEELGLSEEELATVVGGVWFGEVERSPWGWTRGDGPLSRYEYLQKYKEIFVSFTF